MSKKVSIQRQSNKKSLPYRVKFMGLTISVHTKDEAKRVKKYTEKVISLLASEH